MPDHSFRDELLQGYRGTKKVALHETYSHVCQDRNVFHRFGALGNHITLQSSSESYNGFYDCPALRIVSHAAYEIGVEFEIFWMAIEHHAVIRMPEANIVERNANTCAAQSRDGVRQFGDVARRSVLNDLHRKAIERERVLLGATAERVQKTWILSQCRSMNVDIDPQVWWQTDSFCANGSQAAVVDGPFLPLSAHVVEQNLRRLEVRAAW